MLNFQLIADQLESDGHYQMSESIRLHGSKMADMKAAHDFYDQCVKESETANANGTYKDAVNWIRESSLAACKGDETIGSE